MILIHGYRLELTCRACPEQYDVYDLNNTQVAYFRLRGGRFRVTVPDVGGEEVFSSSPLGEGYFDTDERVDCLTNGILAVQKYYINMIDSTYD